MVRVDEVRARRSQNADMPPWPYRFALEINNFCTFEPPVALTTTKSRIDYWNSIHDSRKNFESCAWTTRQTTWLIIGHERRTDRYISVPGTRPVMVWRVIVRSLSQPANVELRVRVVLWIIRHCSDDDAGRSSHRVALLILQVTWTGCSYPHCLKSWTLTAVTSDWLTLKT